ncbi:MAG: LPP20 family lipoprotein, partial [Treponema sp.]|nr:LPP20 family lipoprotein [Treponema sp.]
MLKKKLPLCGVFICFLIFSACGSSAAPKGGVVKPAWVDSVDSVYNRALYIAAVGYAANRAMAEKNAFANLTAIFGQSIQADQIITNTYQEAVSNGVTAGWTDTIVMDNTIKTSASLDTLAGAEIMEVWFDSNRTWYAAAVMERVKAIRLYNDMYNANQVMINNLVTMDQAEKNSLEGFSR